MTLMPAPGGDYYPCCTDGFTYQGFARIAEALADMGHPEGPRLRKEAGSYREDILEVLRRVRQTNPELPPYPERLYGPEGWGSFVTGAIVLVDSGLIDPRDTAFESIESYTKKNFNLNVLGLWGRCQTDDKHLSGSYYMVAPEDIYHYGFVVRGEIEKALLTFYSTLAFGVDKETLGAIERFSLYDRRYAPFFIDSSGAMRICGMIRRSLLLEKELELRLLPATPRRWLQPGKEIELLDAGTYFGKLNLRVESRVDQGNIAVELVLRKDRPDRLRKILLRLPHPDKQPMKQVTVNGAPWKSFDAAQEIIELEPSENRYQILAQY